MPPLAYFLKNQILPIAGARPTQYTSYTVSKNEIERDTNDIMKLDPGVSKRGLYKGYVYLHGWKIITTAKGTIMKSALAPNRYLFIVVLSSINYPKLIIEGREQYL